MSDWLTQVWTYEIQVVPVLIAMSLIEIPTALRRLQRFYYVPIYFSVFPLRELNADLAVYLGEDWFVGGEPSDQQAEQLRKRIVTLSVVSLTLSALVIPLFAGFASSLFLSGSQAQQFVVVFLSYKGIGIIRAIIGFREHAIGTKRNIAFLTLIYVTYLGIASEMIIQAFLFARPFAETGNWWGLFRSTSELVFSRVMVGFLLLTLLATLFANLIMDRRIRAENLAHRRPEDGG